MPPCSRSGCVSIATRGDLCAIHGAGYSEHDGASELRCDNCRKLLGKTEWYRRDGISVTHAKACEPHPDVLKERAKVTA